MEYDSLLKPPESKCLKSGRVFLKPGEGVGEHKTENREEIIVVLKGIATVILGESSKKIKAGDVFYISPETIHNVKNNSSEDLEYIFVVGLFN